MFLIKMNKRITILVVLVILLLAWIFLFNGESQKNSNSMTDNINGSEVAGEVVDSAYPLSIDYLRDKFASWRTESEIKIEQKLSSGTNYNKYIASYESEGLKIYGLLTVPFDNPLIDSGWPVIIFNHGYISPSVYRTTERYVAYMDAFSRAGYIVFKSDYRGHGNSEGEASGGYGSPSYTIDVLNAVAAIKKFDNPSNSSGQVVDPDRIGMWGHSMGGFITLRSMVTSKDIKAGVIWGGVMASYPDLINNWRRSTYTPRPLPSGSRRWRQVLTEQFGTPEKNPGFWNSISANSYLKDISGPIQLHHGEDDASVPVEFSEKLDKELRAVEKTSELFVYPGDDHNISNNFNIAIQHSVEFFDKHLK
jgi:uncharacterized protein